MAATDDRAFARIEADLSCNVATSDSSFEAQVLNLSRSGAAVLGPPNATARDAQVTLFVEREEGLLALLLPAKVVRVEDRGAQWLYAVHFDSLPPDSQAELLMLLKLMAAGKGQGRRAAPRVSARIAVRCKSAQAFRATLADLSRGGLSVRCPRPVELGSTLAVSFGVEGMSGLVEVQGEVGNVQVEPSGAYRAGIRFSPYSPALQQQILILLDVLLGLGPRQAVLEDDDDDDPGA